MNMELGAETRMLGYDAERNEILRGTKCISKLRSDASREIGVWEAVIKLSFLPKEPETTERL